MRPFRSLTDIKQRRTIQGLILAAGAVVYVFAFDPGRSLVMLLVTSYGIICQLVPLVAADLYRHRATTAGPAGNPRTAISSSGEAPHG